MHLTQLHHGIDLEHRTSTTNVDHDEVGTYLSIVRLMIALPLKTKRSALLSSSPLVVLTLLPVFRRHSLACLCFMVLSPESFIHLDQGYMTPDQIIETLTTLRGVPFHNQATKIASYIHRSLGIPDMEDLKQYIESMNFNDPGETVTLDFKRLQDLCA